MIDDRTRQMIEWYLPNPPDPELGFGEYYYRQSTMKGEQVIKVKVTGIFPGEMHQPEEYEIYQIRSDGAVGWMSAMAITSEGLSSPSCTTTSRTAGIRPISGPKTGSA